MEMYSKPDGHIFGYRPEPNRKFKYNIQENYQHGRFCESGLGRIMTENMDGDGDSYEMECVSIGSIEAKSDAGVLLKDFKCSLNG